MKGEGIQGSRQKVPGHVISQQSDAGRRLASWLCAVVCVARAPHSRFGSGGAGARGGRGAGSRSGQSRARLASGRVCA
ncbi:unnamed protein product [Danaus chrysippus]|uniref:(African queen) hypothetical protein n=1 Tax=Danaus chrysippus TaxID=151541 RepID=A0A8J2VSP9_9NEOP|nr:unnamed protein product [Danaus chrysippus]